MQRRAYYRDRFFLFLVAKARFHPRHFSRTQKLITKISYRQSPSPNHNSVDINNHTCQIKKNHRNRRFDLLTLISVLRRTSMRRYPGRDWQHADSRCQVGLPERNYAGGYKTNEDVILCSASTARALAGRSRRGGSALYEWRSGIDGIPESWGRSAGWFRDFNLLNVMKGYVLRDIDLVYRSRIILSLIRNIFIGTQTLERCWNDLRLLFKGRSPMAPISKGLIEKIPPLKIWSSKVPSLMKKPVFSSRINIMDQGTSYQEQCDHFSSNCYKKMRLFGLYMVIPYYDIIKWKHFVLRNL